MFELNFVTVGYFGLLISVGNAAFFGILKLTPLSKHVSLQAQGMFVFATLIEFVVGLISLALGTCFDRYILNFWFLPAIAFLPCLFWQGFVETAVLYLAYDRYKRRKWLNSKTEEERKFLDR